VEIVVHAPEGAPVRDQPVEVVERKGIGHPDTICDAIAESICARLCGYYLERFGSVLHHNVDKVLLRGGGAAPRFGGGEVREPFELYLGGRATGAFGGVVIPVADLAVDASREWLRSHLRGLDVDSDVAIHPLFRTGSSDLADLFLRRAASGAALANDTSCGAGFWPPTPLERMVLAVEARLNAADVKRIHPEIGEDVKVMGVRCRGRVTLTVGCAFVARFVPDMASYEQGKAAAAQLVVEAAREAAPLPVEVSLNAADDPRRGQVFLTVTGTSAEAGDDGEAGRGNRVNGLITPYRPMTLEAAAGKNPVSHVGKLYNLAAARTAAALAGEIAGVEEASCTLVSQIGRPVDDPLIADIALRHAGGGPALELAHRAEEIVRSELSSLGRLSQELLRGEVKVY
jgi:S-adenosylmethionine synthetase